VWRAAERLGIEFWAAAADATDGLLAIGERVIFRHPLVRSAVYRSATAPERRAVHLALAEATDPQIDPDRRAWHLAQASTAPDERVAMELERSATRAQARGGLGAAAAFLERGATLWHTHSPNPMAAVLDELAAQGRPLPDLVVADHGWAGFAGQQGIDSMGYADCNDPALFLAEAEGTVQVTIPLDDHVTSPRHYDSMTAYLLDAADLA